MLLTDKHIRFEDDCRRIFVGQTIRAVVYGELKYYTKEEEENNINVEPYYKTKYPDIDTIDHSIYFKTDDKTIYVYWDNTFTCYGLSSKQIDLSETTNDYEQKWDVSNELKWQKFIGQKIIDFKINWENISISELGKSSIDCVTYPQTFEIVTEIENHIFISASELKDQEYYSQMDNLLVTTNYELLNKLMLIEERQIQKFHSQKSVFKNPFNQ